MSQETPRGTTTMQTTTIQIRYFDFGSEGQRVVILCSLGHVISSAKIDATFIRSQFAADLGKASSGQDVHWHRLAAKCCGAGH